LKQVFGGFVILVKLEADELVDRFPVERHHPLHGERLARGGLDERQLGGWKTVAVAANRRVSIAPHQGIMLARRPWMVVMAGFNSTPKASRKASSGHESQPLATGGL
jgi:hypothetical protein